MRILVLGATGATGQLVVEQALAAGHEVRALVRNPEKLTVTGPKLQVVAGSATDPADVSKTIYGADVVISTLGGPEGSVMTDATRAILAGARKHGVQRVVVLSTFAVQRDRLTVPAKIVTGLSLSDEIKDKTLAETELTASELDWTIVYASLLTDEPAAGGASVLSTVAKRSMSHKISRADLAAWLLWTAVGPRWYSRQSVALTGKR